MKTVILPLVILTSLLAGPLMAGAQDDGEGPLLDYGDKRTGRITNTTFEEIYTFEGSAQDLVIIQMNGAEDSSLDPYLYLTTLQNEILAQNDDTYSYDSRVIAQLPADATYQIVATRNGGRGGSGEGSYTLSLDLVPPTKTGSTLEGTAAYDEEPGTHVFQPTEAGIYTITYNHVRGTYFPALVIYRMDPTSAYEEEIATLSGNTLHGGSITLEMELGLIYIFSVQSGYYSYPEFGAQALYTIQLDKIEQ